MRPESRKPMLAFRTVLSRTFWGEFGDDSGGRAEVGTLWVAASRKLRCLAKKPSLTRDQELLAGENTTPLMRHRLFNLAAACSMVLCALSCAMWGRSHWRGDSVFQRD